MRWIFGRFVDGRGAFALLAVRVVMGLAFVHHGFGQIGHPFSWMGPASPMPGILQALAALSEFGGGIALIVGLLTPFASLGLLCTMAVASWTHFSRGDPFVGKGPSYELALVYLVISLLFLLMGPGRISLDAKIFGREANMDGAPTDSA
ncbi:MAG: DoxX family protein [Armatimonadetes bacterium CG2_30_59_28]|nr:DoxX family protein [Armatimonadota bacterium]OIO90824.1 MAG: DoxX family protein [Armatimonadetes bacterium CG2_30_59_28]PIU66201.1 MAG: DoxX family protein [Armatimonadetes bacterium CG07_land_8_20_14_0_80_59_28]PIX39086.1 MAG: DoxX family protein [Armatimonadetes bacterium CG_4_8_14_3_um_filter_58_9]PIY43457.1 MAG: DoxX family protein [Armatimonadetes bacterium CG_4_10_14_3_um_filter_59_10]PJB70463.1 MAG: DoxX family protein [Armatimonadetes bacterium CG_4_9_14_3_um_filter_58_7]